MILQKTDYQVTKFPDGQLSVAVENLPVDNRYVIARSIANMDDLYIILALADVIRNMQPSTKVELYCPYLLAARSDRRFSENASFDLKLIAGIINSAKFDRVYFIDIHSDVALALIDRSKNIPAECWYSELIDYHHDTNDLMVISPDAGAYKKLSKAKLRWPMISANKYRNHETGELTTQINGDVLNKTCVIIDDICDGGRTFVQLSKTLRELGAARIVLVVTHGIFSAGLPLEGIDFVITTNSYREIHRTENLEVMNVFYPSFINQCLRY